MLVLKDAVYVSEGVNSHRVELAFRAVTAEKAETRGTFLRAVPKSQSDWDGRTFKATPWILQKIEEELAAQRGYRLVEILVAP